MNAVLNTCSHFRIQNGNDGLNSTNESLICNNNNNNTDKDISIYQLTNTASQYTTEGSDIFSSYFQNVDANKLSTGSTIDESINGQTGNSLSYFETDSKERSFVNFDIDFSNSNDLHKDQLRLVCCLKFEN